MASDVNYETFEILIGEESDGGVSVRVLDSPHGQAKGLFQLDEDALAELIDALEVIEARETDIDTLAQIGEFLFDALFADDILLLYRQSLAIVHGQESRLRVRLHIEPPALAALPWEFLYDAETASFPAISPETALMRFIPMKLPVRASTIEPPLRVLAVIANPEGVTPLNVEQEKQILKEALQPQIDANRIALHFVDRARIEAVNQAMRSFEPHIFHFVGHGMFDGESAYVVMEDEAGMAHPVDETVFREIFASSKETRLAVLNACQTATTSSTRPLAGLAPNLLQRKLSAVIAMQYTVADKAALIFARDLYRSLALGLPLEAAVSEARKAIYMECGPDMPDWGTPVLFLRAKDGALFDVVKPTSLPATPEIPPPPPPAKPPVVDNFVGRETELAYFAQKLAEGNLALVAGMPGVGKSAVAAQLAAMSATPEKTFWYSFHAGEGVDILIWKMAAFLAFNHQSSVWQMLQSVTLSGGQLPPPDVLFDYLFQAIRGQDYLICLDDFQRVEADPLLEKLVQRLRPALTAGDLRLIVTTQHVPSFVQPTQFKRLTGLELADTVRLLDHYGVTLRAESLAHLHAHTGGNAQLLVLAANSLKDAADPEEVVYRLTNSADVERFLLSEVDANLDSEERLAMSGVAVLLGTPGTRDAIEEVLDGSSVRRTLSYLANRYLLETVDGARDLEYAQHSVVQSFYYDLLSRRDRREMHRRAAVYYEFEEADDLRAAQHYQAAGEDVRAATLLTRDAEKTWGMTWAGQLRSVHTVLVNLQERRFQSEPILWAKVLIMRGITAYYQSETAEALTHLAEAESILAGLAESTPPTELLGPQAWQVRERAIILRYQDPSLAKMLIEEILAKNAEIGGLSRRQEADLSMQLGLVLRNVGDAAGAQTWLERSLEIAPKEAEMVTMRVYLVLGVLYFLQNKVAEGSAATEKSLFLAEKLNDPNIKLQAISNLGSFQHVTGEWTSAVHNYQMGLNTASQLGNAKEVARIGMNMGILQFNQGNFVEAEKNLTHSLRLARQHDWPETALSSALYLTELSIAKDDLTQAGPLLAEAQGLIERTGFVYQTPMMTMLHAVISLAQGDQAAAQNWAERSVHSAQSQAMRHEEGMGLRVLALAQAAGGQSQAALENFERSLLLLDDNPFEAAITRLAWAETLIGLGEENIAIDLLEEAESTFTQLNAKYYLAKVQALLD